VALGLDVLDGAAPGIAPSLFLSPASSGESDSQRPVEAHAKRRAARTGAKRARRSKPKRTTPEREPGALTGGRLHPLSRWYCSGIGRIGLLILP